MAQETTLGDLLSTPLSRLGYAVGHVPIEYDVALYAFRRLRNEPIAQDEHVAALLEQLQVALRYGDVLGLELGPPIEPL